MKILNWNVCSFSRNQQKTIEKALNLDADIMCLQEVTPASLQYFKESTDYNLLYAHEQKGSIEDYYIVILSKHPFAGNKTITFYSKPINSLIARLVDWYSKGKPMHEALTVTLNISGTILNICNLHLSWPVTPSIRIEQFVNLFRHLDNFDNLIVCGDFNTFGGLKYYNILTSLFFKYKPRDILFNERKWLDEEIETRQFQNPFKNTRSYSTLPINAQIDHILVPNNFEILNAECLNDSFKSDHRPLLLEIGLP